LSKGFRQPFDRQLKNGKRGFKMRQLDGKKNFAGCRKGKHGQNTENGALQKEVPFSHPKSLT